MFFFKKRPLPRLAITFFVFCAFFGLAEAVNASTISGFVYAKSGRLPLPDIDVELLNNDEQMRSRQKTDGSGRYSFSNLPDGRYTVRVMAFRYDYEDQSIMVEIITLTARGQGSGNTMMMQDFYLVPRRGSLMELENGVIFAQEVPPDAKRQYEGAVADISRGRVEDGTTALRKAIAIFPRYYLALYQLGLQTFLDKKYGEAAQLFMTAGAVNQKSAAAYYYVGFSLYNLGKDYNKAALVSLETARTIAPSSVQVLYLLGKVERAEGNFLTAESHLIQAKKMARVSIPEIHKELAQLYANDLKRYENAADELESYLKASKLATEDEAKTRKVISDLRAKATPPAKTT